jgi:predicted transcriptional regulator
MLSRKVPQRMNLFPTRQNVLELEAGAMNARDVMTSAVISATGETPVRDIAQLLLQNQISAVPILDKSGAPIGMVSEGDLVGRDETQRDTRREWWLALLAEGELLNPDFLSVASTDVV